MLPHLPPVPPLLQSESCVQAQGALSGQVFEACSALHPPSAHEYPVGASAGSRQSLLSAAPAPVHAPVHWLFALTHLPLEQSLSATHRHALPSLFGFGAGTSEVGQEYTGVAVHEVGISPDALAWQWKLSVAPVPVHVPVQAAPVLAHALPLHCTLVLQAQAVFPVFGRPTGQLYEATVGVKIWQLA